MHVQRHRRLVRPLEEALACWSAPSALVPAPGALAEGSLDRPVWRKRLIQRFPGRKGPRLSDLQARFAVKERFGVGIQEQAGCLPLGSHE
jgi:hypothetical protein